MSITHWLNHWKKNLLGLRGGVARSAVRKRSAVPSVLETLEDRVLLAAASFDAGTGTLTVDFSAADEVVTLFNNGTSVSIISNGSPATGTSSVTSASLRRVVATDSGNLSGQRFRLSGTSAYSLSGGLDVSGAEIFLLGTDVDTSSVGASVVVGQQIVLNADLTSTDGNILLSANQQVDVSTGLFIGVDLFGGSVLATGAGTVDVRGRGGDDASNLNAGIRITEGGKISGASTTVKGTGGSSNGFSNYGVYVTGIGSKITSTGGDVDIEATGGGVSGASQNYGLGVVFSGEVSAGGNGNVNIVAKGGVGASSDAVYVAQAASGGPSAQITSNGGTVAIDAQATDLTNSGVRVAISGLIGTGGGANLTIVSDSVSIDTTSGVVNSGTGTTSFQTRTTGFAINLGSSDVPGSCLGFGAGELNRITAGTLIIGDATAGNITVDAAVAPTSINQLELITGSSIIDSNFVGNDITVASLAMTAVSGIGTSHALETAVSNLEATTATGGIFIANTGNLSIGGVNSTLHGVQVTGASGGIDLQNTSGDVRITTAGDFVKAPGNVSIKTLTSGNIITANNNGLALGSYTGAVNSTAGTLTLNAVGNLDLGETANLNPSGDVQSSGNLVLTAGGSITVDDQTSVQTFGNGSTISITAGTDVSILSTHSAGSFIGSQNLDNGLISINTGAGGTFTINISTSTPGVFGGIGGLQVTADNMVLLDDIDFRNGGTVSLTPVTPGRPIDLGTDTAGSLGLTSTEINLIKNASALNIGSSASGTITVSDSLTPSITTLNLVTGDSVLSTTSSGTDITVTNLNITAPNGIGSSSNPLNINADQLSTNSAGGNGDQYLREADNVTILNGGSLSAGTGMITLVGGEFRLDGSINAADVLNAGTLAGSGVINGNLESTLVLSPGGDNGVGTITVNGNFVGNRIFNITLAGLAAVAGVDYDQLVVNGTVDSSLMEPTYFTSTLAFGTVPALTVVTLIANDGQDRTTENVFGFPEVTLAGNKFRSFPNGGTGNDIVLVRSDVPATAYVDDSFTANNGQVIDDADLSTTGNQPAIFGINAFRRIYDGLTAIDSTGTVIINAGTYAEAVEIDGAETILIGGPDAAQAVTVDSLATVSGTTVSLVGTSSLTFGDASDTAVEGLISGSGSLTKQGAGIATISGDNTYSGTTTVSAGTLRVTANNALGTTAGGTTVASGATLDFRNIAYSTAEAVELQGGTLSNSNGTTTFAGAVTLTADSSFATNASVLVQAGAILGSYGISKSGAGTLRLSSTSNSFTSLTITSGTTQLGNSGVIPDTASISISGSFDVNGFDETLDAVSGTGSIVNTSPSTTKATLTLGAGNNVGDSKFNGAITGGINLVKTGTGRQTLGSGSSSYSGTTTINNGTLAVTTENSGTAARALGSVNGRTFVNSGGVLEFVNVAYDLAEPITVNGGTIRASAIGGNPATGASSFGGAITLSTGTASLNVTIGARLTLSGVLGGDQGLDKTGIGTLILTTDNTYSGNTTVSGGTLLVNGSLASSSAVTVNDGGTLGGSGTVNGTVNVASGGAVSPGNSPDVLNTGSVAFVSGSTFVVEVNGTTAGTFDQLNVTGTVSLGDATLSASGAIISDVGQQIVIIANDDDDPIVGTFDDIDEGDIVVINGLKFRITYHGGTNSNDVVLTEVDPPNDVSVTMTDDRAHPVPGGTITYTISVTNSGPFTASATSLIDNFPAAIAAADWTSDATGGATGNTASGSGDINETLVLPAGASVTYTVVATISSTATGSFTNEATVSQVGDSDSSNDTATDTDTLDNFVTIAKIGDASEPSTNGKFRVTQQFASALDTIVTYSIAGGAQNGIDYSTLTGSVTIPAGSTSADIDVLVTNDLIVEADESIELTLTGFTQASPGVQLDPTPSTLTATVDLTDDNDTNVLSISAPTITETNADQTVTFTVTSPNAVEGGFDIAISASNGTAGSADYELVTTTVHFDGTAGETQSVTVTINGDTIVEANETFTVTLGAVTNTTSTQAAAITSEAAATGTITNDDTATYTISDATVAEGGDLSFTVSLSNPVDVDTTVNVTVANGTASNTDFDHTAIPVTFLAGTTTAQVIVVATTVDNVVEANETLTASLALTAPLTGGRLSDTTDTGAGTINNDDTATYTISDATVTEGGELSFTVSLSNPVDVDTTVNVTFSDGSTSNDDFDHTSIPVTFLAGSTTPQVIVVATTADSTVEADESLTVHLALNTPLTSGRLSDTTDTGAGTINNDDTATYTISDATVTEGGDLSFTVSLSNPVDVDTTVNVTFTDGTTSNDDFDHTSIPVTFLAGSTTSQVVVVPTVGDSTVEDDEVFTVNLALSAPLTDGRLSDTADTGTGSINNDDTATFTIGNVTVNEGDGSLVFDLVTDNPLDIDVTIEVTFADVSATGGGTDYASTTQQVTFLAGQTAKQVTVAINNDNIVEATEDFDVTLGTTTPLGNRVVNVTDTATGTIIDNDAATFSIEDASVSEGAGTLVFNLVTDNPLDIDVTITVTFTAGLATGGGTDFVSTTQQITFLAGETSKQVLVSIDDDAIVESTETFTATLSTTTELGGRTVLATDTATGTITDNDVATISIAKLADGAEANSPTNGKFRITQSAVSSTDTVINYTINGDATAGNDYTTLTGTATILAGQTTVDIDVAVLNDALIESTESVIVTLATLGDHDADITLDVTEATVNITDSDTPVIISGATASVVENTPSATVVLNVDADPIPLAPGHTLSYSLSGADAAWFDIDTATGEIRFKTSPDFEAPSDLNHDNVYEVTVTATADTTPNQSTSQNLTITVTPENDITPVFTNPSPTYEIAENSTNGTVVGGVSATDGDSPAQTLTYSIVSGNLGGAFTIDPATGQITVASSTALNFELVASFAVTVRVTDNAPTARTADAIVTINVTNVVEIPAISIVNPEGTYHLGKSVALVSPVSTFSYEEVANPNYDGAQLKVSIVSGRGKRDKLTIAENGEGAGQINTKGRKVFLGSTQIGTVKGGRGRNPDLVVTLNANATTAGIATLIKRVNFQARTDVGTDRTIHIQVTNIAGVDSNVATRTIAVVS